MVLLGVGLPAVFVVLHYGSDSTWGASGELVIFAIVLRNGVRTWLRDRRRAVTEDDLGGTPKSG